MNLKEQLYVCTLARHQTISRAAEALYISPPALSSYISNMERALGIPLFDRSGKSFTLTPLGEEYVRRAEKMLEMKAEFDSLVERSKTDGHEIIRIGVQQRRAIALVPQVLKRFHHEYPKQEVIFRDGICAELEQLYHTGMVDYILSSFEEPIADAACRVLAEEQVLLVLPKGHPAEMQAFQVPGDDYPHLELSQLDGETFIIPTEGQSMGQTARKIIAASGIRPSRTIEISHFDIILSMIEQEMGVGFNRIGYVREMRANYPSVSYYHIGKKGWSSRIYLMWRKGRQPTEAEERLLQIIGKCLQQDVSGAAE